MTGDTQYKTPADPETLRHHYEQVCVSYRAIDDFRGKLLTLWPILGGAAGGVALLLQQNGGGGLWAIALFGFVVSIGVGVYEWHQTLRCDLLKKSARELERRMGFGVGTGQFLSLPRAFKPARTGPPISEIEKLIEQEDQERESREREKLLDGRVIKVGFASAIVYLSVILGWLGLFLWAALLRHLL
jgi:hypothetical protein